MMNRLPSVSANRYLSRLMCGLLLCACLLASSQAVAFWFRQSADTTSLDAQRSLFQRTYQQLRSGALVDIAPVQRQLGSYPLAPYLDYQLLRNQVTYRRADAAEVTLFLQQHGDLAVTERLRLEWLQYLAQQQDWLAFLQLAGTADMQDPALNCYQWQARLAVEGSGLRLLENSLTFWINNQPLPDACQGLTDHLYQLGFLQPDHYWQAARLLIQQGDSRGAWQLSPRLHEPQRLLLDFWRRGQLNPDNRLTALAAGQVHYLQASAEDMDQMLVDLLKRLSASNPQRTRLLMQQLAGQERLTPRSQYQLQEHLALQAAASQAPDTLQLFEQLPAEQRSARVREWYARTLLRQQHWAPLLDAIAQLPASLRSQNEWRYWQAQALQHLDQEEDARLQLRQLAAERHYYGFLAARELGLPPAMNALPVQAEPDRLLALSDRPGIQRAAELFFTGFDEDAQREWQQALADADAATWQQAAWLASHWGLHHLSVQAAHRGGLQDALELRFPLPHLDQLKPLAEQTQTDLALILALIRKESLFNPQARSRAGALGLMQIMPSTGRQVFRQLQLADFSEQQLLQPEHNLNAGVHYLSQLLHTYQHNPVLAAAAYNAGPGRTNAWIERLGAETDPLWVEQITYAETRDYVKSLLAFREVYAWRLAQAGIQLAELDESAD